MILKSRLMLFAATRGFWIQKLKNEREEIEKMLAENEIKLAEYEEKVAKCERQFDALKQEKNMILNTHEDDLLN